MKKTTLLIIMCIISLKPIMAQTESAPSSNGIKLYITGQGMTMYISDKDYSSFGNVKMHLMPLAKLSDNLFLETEIEVETSEGDASFGLEQVNLIYRVCPYLNIHAGRFLPKFGGYRGRMGEGYVSRLATDPLGYGDGGIGPMVETGIGFQAGLPLGSAKMNYDIWISDGPQISGDSTGPVVGEFDYEAFSDNNKNKAIGGRIGFLPLSNSSLEVGFSYEKAAKTGPTGTSFENTELNMMAFDLNYFNNIKAIKSTVRVTGEWKNQNETYPAMNSENSFKSTSSAYYGVIAIRPALLKNNFIRNLEIAYRYSQYDRSKNKPDAGEITNRSDIGINYWFKWNAVLKLNYVMQQNLDNGMFIAQVLFGF